MEGGKQAPVEWKAVAVEAQNGEPMDDATEQLSRVALEAAPVAPIVRTGEFEEDPEMELGADDIEEVVFDEQNDRPPSDDEEDGDQADMEDEEDQEDQADTGRKAPREAVPDSACAVFTGHSDSVYCVDISPDGSLAVSGGGDDVGYIWETATGNVLHKLPGHTDSVSDCSFNFDGTLAATAAYDSTVKIWDARTGALSRTLEGPSTEIEFITWHSKGNVILAGSEDATAWIWDASTGNCLSVLAGHETVLTCGAFTPNGKRALTGSLDGSVRLWDPKTSMCTHSFTGHDWHQAGVVSLACSAEKPIMAAGGQDGTVRLASLEQKRVIASLSHSSGVGQGGQADGNEEPSSVEAIAFCSAQPFFAAGGTNGALKIFDLNTQTCRQELQHEDAVVGAAFVDGSHMLVSASADGTSRLWDSRTGQCARILTGHRNMILGLAVRGNVSISSSDDHTCRVAKLS